MKKYYSFTHFSHTTFQYNLIFSGNTMMSFSHLTDGIFFFQQLTFQVNFTSVI